MDRYGIQGNTGIAELLSSVMILTVVFIFAYTLQIFMRFTSNSSIRFKTLLNYTANTDDETITIHQDTNKYPNAFPIGLSINERTGIEFAYSFFLYVNQKTFRDDQSSMKHVFHKGYTTPWPLMGPGVFMLGNTNTMRVIMNTYSDPYAHVDIVNIPVQKWFHVVLNCYKSGLDVYVNGTLANRISFTGAVPYQNFQDIIIFSNLRVNKLSAPRVSALEGKDFPMIEGAMSGQISSLAYARYALSLSEIRKIHSAGRSTATKKVSYVNDSYLSDDWWANQNMRTIT
jgi:hypothetical protein